MESEARNNWLMLIPIMEIYPIFKVVCYASCTTAIGSNDSTPVTKKAANKLF